MLFTAYILLPPSLKSKKLDSLLPPIKREREREMKHWSLLISILFLIQKQLIPIIRVEAGDGFIKTRGVQFVLNGSPYYANGFNAYWLMYVATDPSQRNKVSSAFQEAKGHGLTVARTWAFSDGGYRALQESPGSYNEQTFQVTSNFFISTPWVIDFNNKVFKDKWF